MITPQISLSVHSDETIVKRYEGGWPWVQTPKTCALNAEESRAFSRGFRAVGITPNTTTFSTIPWLSLSWMKFRLSFEKWRRRFTREKLSIEPSEISLMFRFLKFIDGWMNEVVTKRVSGFLVSDLVNKGEVFLFSRNRSDTVSNWIVIANCCAMYHKTFDHRGIETNDGWSLTCVLILLVFLNLSFQIDGATKEIWIFFFLFESAVDWWSIKSFQILLIYHRSNEDRSFLSGMNLQICFMNETPSDTESPCSETDSSPGSTPTSLNTKQPQKQQMPIRPQVLSLPPLRLDTGSNSAPIDEADFFARQARLQTEARMALAQAKEMAHMQMEVERQRLKQSPITEMVRSSLEKVSHTSSFWNFISPSPFISNNACRTIFTD